MTPIETKAHRLVNRLIEADDDDSLHQRIVKRSYDAHPDTHPSDFVQDLPEGEQLAVLLGNLNNQVNNGGFDQWMANRYGTQETLDELRGHLEKHKSKYPAFGRLGDILDTLEATLSDHDLDVGDYQQTFHREFERLMSEGNWDALDDLLGGTDLFRNIDQWKADWLEEMVDVEEVELPNGQFNLAVTADGNRIPVDKDILGPFTQEELPERTQELRDFIADDDDVKEMLDDQIQDALGEQAQEYLEKHLDYIQGLINKLDQQYYSISKDVMSQAESVLKDDLNMDPSLLDKALAGLKRAGQAVAGKVGQVRKSAGQAVKKAADYIAGEAT